MNNVSQKRLELQNAIRANKSEIKNCDDSLDAIATGTKVSHPKAYYEGQKALLESENAVLQGQIDSGDYLKPDSAGTVSVDTSRLESVLTSIDTHLSKLADVLSPKQP